MSHHSYRALQLVVAIAVVCSASCGGGGGGGGSSQVNQAPVAAADVVRADGAALESLDVLANDDDPDGDSLTVSIEDAPPVGTASVNTDGTVRVADLPGDFKGVTRFSYRVTDSDGATATATAAIFVGTDPIQVIFAGDEIGDGSTEIYLTDFISPARALTDATDGNFRLRGFVASANGATVVYRREDTTAPTTTDLYFVSTDAPEEEVRVELPAGLRPLLDAQGRDQFRVSADGRWIAVVAGDGSTSAAYVVDTNDPQTAMRASPVGAAHAELLRFAPNSAALYFLASSAANGSNRLLYTVALDDLTTAAQISAPLATVSDDVLDYSISPDQSRILLRANRSGRVGLYFVAGAQLQNEVQVSHSLALGETLVASTVGLEASAGGSALVQRVAYTTQTLLIFRTFVAEVAANPNPRPIGAVGGVVIGFRPDDAALLYSRNGQVQEAVIDSAQGDVTVGDGGFGWYDSTGNIVLLQQSLPYPALASTTRGAFGTAQSVGTSGLAAHYINTSGFGSGIVLIGEGAATGSPPASVRLALVNAMAPEELLDLATFDSPLGLTSDVAQIVAN